MYKAKSVEARPITPIKDFERSLLKAELSKSEEELIDYIRFIGVFNQITLKKELNLSSKPPILSIICDLSRKIGNYMPSHFFSVRKWSEAVSKDGVRWDGNLICSIVWNIDGEMLTPEEGTAQYHTFAVHKELFKGFE
ncbi:hypothetical protein [Prochlorococcus sp. MIT 1307]|uniref:hypothetical protein n=1 Tax=Prochlorococcus sp. MIT 1307 TaxID=3096219 RepID=UPI002A75A334|nr:hypothetical protein [Prochlorococcus sp. MIT 1307]